MKIHTLKNQLVFWWNPNSLYHCVDNLYVRVSFNAWPFCFGWGSQGRLPDGGDLIAETQRKKMGQEGCKLGLKVEGTDSNARWKKQAWWCENSTESPGTWSELNGVSEGEKREEGRNRSALVGSGRQSEELRFCSSGSGQQLQRCEQGWAMTPLTLTVSQSSRGDCTVFCGGLGGTGARRDACVWTLRPSAVHLNYHSVGSQR